MRSRNSFMLVFSALISSCAPSTGHAVSSVPLYDWDFTPSHVKLTSPQSILGYVTIRNLPNSPVNLLGSQWYALDMYPGDAVEGGPFRITGLSSSGFSSMNLAPGQSKTVLVAGFAPRAPMAVGYSGLLIAGAHMRVLGPNNEFIDVGGNHKQLRVTVVPEPGIVPLCASAAGAVLMMRRDHGSIVRKAASR